MHIQDLLTADKAPTAAQINQAILDLLTSLATRFVKADPANPWANSPQACLRRMTLQMAEQAHSDDAIAHLIRNFRLGDAALTRAAYDLDVADDLDKAADEVTFWAESICSELRRESVRVAA